MNATLDAIVERLLRLEHGVPDDMRQEVLDDLRAAIEETEVDVKMLEAALEQRRAELDKLRDQAALLAGRPTTEAYNLAFQLIEEGQDARRVSADFRATFQDVTAEQFAAAMYRRRKQKKQAPKTNA